MAELDKDAQNIAEEERPVRKKRREEREPENIENTKINFKNGLTVYEGKAVFLLTGSFVSLIFALVMYYLREDISVNLTTIVTTFILCIAGVTTAEHAINFFKTGDLFGKGK